MLKIKNRKDIKIGYWSTFCCHKDLREIKTEFDIDNVIDWRDGDLEEIQVWESKKKALLDIRKTWINSHRPDNNCIEEINEIDDMLKDR